MKIFNKEMTVQAWGWSISFAGVQGYVRKETGPDGPTYSTEFVGTYVRDGFSDEESAREFLEQRFLHLRDCLNKGIL